MSPLDYFPDVENHVDGWMEYMMPLFYKAKVLFLTVITLLHRFLGVMLPQKEPLTWVTIFSSVRYCEVVNVVF